MIRDLETERPTEGFSADVCIIGAGAAGIALAVELIAQGKHVLLLEGGGADMEERSQEPYQSEVIGLTHRGVHTGRFRAMGGTTTKWGGQILEFEPLDFESRHGVAGSGWPFSKEVLKPFYERALSLEGLAGVTRNDTAVWAEIGLEPPTFEGLEPYFSRWCPEPQFARLHRRALENEPNLMLWLHANAVDLDFEGDRLLGVKCRTLAGAEHIFRASRFVFCLGAIESSRFFLQPRPGGLPWNQSGLLGKHFQDHIDANVADIVPLDQKRFHALFDNVFSRGFKYHPKLRLSRATQKKHGTLNVAATMFFVSETDEELGRLKAMAKNILGGRLSEVRAADLANAGRNLPLLMRHAIRYKFQHRIYNPASASIKLRVHCEQEPTSASSITLSSQRDALGLLRTRLDWQISDSELATIRGYVLQAKRALAGIADVVPDQRLISGDPAFRQQCDDSNHHMGGMRMAERAEDGVVDTNLRLHGTQNCYICSSAVFPTSSFSNPTHTLLALAVRLAEHLR